MSDPTPPSSLVRSGVRTTTRKLVIVVVMMFGFGWALIPVYRMICDVSGVNLLTGRDPAAEAAARNTQVDASRTVTVEFDANRQGPWRFRPLVGHLDVHPGELITVEYELINTETRAMSGQAIPSYAPRNSAEHFHKLQCFCFSQQQLAGGESRHFPVVFFVDRDLPRDIREITLSYTFFEIPGAARTDGADGSAVVPKAPAGG
jgi:cytochrome c oxidase assembly protein subunit 11